MEHVAPQSTTQAEVAGRLSLYLDGLMPPKPGETHQRLTVPLNRARKTIIAAQASVSLGVFAFHAGSLIVYRGSVLFHHRIDQYCDPLETHSTWKNCLCNVATSNRFLPPLLTTSVTYVLRGFAVGKQLRHAFQQAYHHGGNIGAASVWAAKLDYYQLLDAGHYADAMHAIEQVFQAYKAAGKRVPHDIIVAVAECLIIHEQFELAHQWAQHAFSQKPSLEAAECLARAKLGKQDFAATERFLASLPKRQRLSAAMQCVLGDTLFAQQRWQEAVRAYKKALKRDATLDEARSAGFIALLLLEREDEAQKMWAPAQAKPLIRADALERFASYFFDVGSYEECEEKLLLIEQSSGDNRFLSPSLRLMLARAQYHQSKFTLAGINLELYLQQRPHALDARFLLLTIENKNRISRLPPLEDLRWASSEEKVPKDATCMISLENFDVLQHPVMLLKGNGRYLFEYDHFQRFHDLVVKDFFDAGPFRGDQLVRLAPYRPNFFERAKRSEWVQAWTSRKQTSAT